MKLAGLVTVVALAAAVAFLIPPLAGAGNGRLIAGDSSNSGEAIAAAARDDPGRLKTIITTRGSERVVYAYSISCQRGRRFDSRTKRFVENTRIRRTIRKPLRNPDSCNVAVNAVIKNGSAGRITVKIFDK